MASKSYHQLRILLTTAAATEHIETLQELLQHLIHWPHR